ncbi:MAG: 4-hydroxy-tetrahydrodipicolinate synthase [bacterium]
MIKGSIVALVTPFLNNKVNYTKLEELIDFHIENKTDGLLLLGTTAETSTLSDNECIEIVKFCISYINDKIDIIVGVCSNNTQKAKNDIQIYEDLGIKYFLVITPYYNKANNTGIYKHFKEISSSISSKIIIYHIPNRTGVTLDFNLIKELSEIENIIGIKEANENFKQTVNLFSLQSENFKIYCGNDEFIIPFLALNAEGIINVSGNIIPKEIHDIYTLYKSNKTKEALDLFNLYKSLINALFLETNPIGIKEAMTILSMNNDELRLPLTNYSLENHNILRKEIINVGKYFNYKV